MLATVQAGEIVVVYRADRFSRDAALGLADINELRARGVGLFIAATREWTPPVDELDPMRQMQLQQGLMVAEFERRLFAQRTASGRRALIERGYWPYAEPPYGYRRVPAGSGLTRLEPDAAEQQVLQLVKQLCGQGMGTVAIAKTLNEAGHRTRHKTMFKDHWVRRITKANDFARRSRGPAVPRLSRPKPGNQAIASEAPAGVAAVLRQKLIDAERVEPVIRHLIETKGCSSYRQLADALNCLELATPRDGRWHPSSVRNVMAVLNIRFRNSPTVGVVQIADEPPLPQRPDKPQRRVLRIFYGLPEQVRGVLQKVTPDILFMRDAGFTAEVIARILGVSRTSVVSIVKRYPSTRAADALIKERVLRRCSGGQSPQQIAKALGLDRGEVVYLIGVERRRVRPPRKAAAPLSAERQRAILASQASGKRPVDILLELGIDNKRERRQVRQWLARHKRKAAAPPAPIAKAAKAPSPVVPESLLQQRAGLLASLARHRRRGRPSKVACLAPLICDLAVQGMNARAIARELGVSDNSVRSLLKKHADPAASRLAASSPDIKFAEEELP
jgi:DNA invertase Pin-like site-specific DNA recombinase